MFTGFQNNDECKDFNNEKGNIRDPVELKSTINEMKNIVKGINSRLENTEEQISNLEDRVIESTQVEQQEKKNKKK